MEIQHLKYFYEVAKQRSFTRAARSLRVGQPAISKMVRLLEADLDLTLFERDKKGIRLTDAGEMLFQYTEQLFEHFHSLKGELQNFKGDCVGALQIGASDNLAKAVIPKMLIRFLERYPQVKAKLFTGTSGAIKQEMLENKVELGFFYTQDGDLKNFEYEELGLIEFLVVTSPKHKRLTHFDSAEFKRLRIPHIGSRPLDYKEPFAALKMRRHLGLGDEALIEVNNKDIQVQIVIDGYGYALAPRHLVAEAVAAKKLKVLKTPSRLLHPLYLAKRKGRLLSKPARFFLEDLKASIKPYLAKG